MKKINGGNYMSTIASYYQTAMMSTYIKYNYEANFFLACDFEYFDTKKKGF